MAIGCLLFLHGRQALPATQSLFPTMEQANMIESSKMVPLVLTYSQISVDCAIDIHRSEHPNPH